MPIYEYRCARCAEVYEMLVRSAADEKALRCPKCSCVKAERVFSVFAAQGTRSKASSAAGSGCASCHSGTCSSCRH